MMKNLFHEIFFFISLSCIKAGNGNRGVGGIFGIPPWPKIFRKYPPPLEILGQAAILFFK